MRAIVRLAFFQQEGSDRVKLEKIAKHEGISLKYLEAIFAALKRQKLVQSFKGRSGGYKLRKHPDEITVLEVVEALEGGITPVDCVEDKKECIFDPAKCSVVKLWSELNHVIKKYLESKSLADIIQDDNNVIKGDF
jgi:Rrf2 family protein